jgi:nucleoid DNA-binding protein
MTKQEIVDNVSAATGLTKVETEAVMKNDRVELRGFGTFGVKHRLPKKARNPGTGETIYLEERYVPTFKPAKKMRMNVLNSLK